MRVALGQFNATVGDLAGNVEKMHNIYNKALEADADLLVFPELAVCGYPPEDLLYKKHFLEDCLSAVEQLAASCPETMIVVGFPQDSKGKTYNSAAVLQKGKISEIYNKSALPNFSVFDERRYFESGKKPAVIDIAGNKVAITICYDIWNIEWLTDFLKSTGPIDMILNISASPFHLGKLSARQQQITGCAKQFSCAVCYCNLVGGQDELVFDGRSMFANSTGKIIAIAKAFDEDLLIADVDPDQKQSIQVEQTSPAAPQPANDLEEAYEALILGTRDYVCKNGFKNVLVGVSGGIDSAVTAAIAVAALGAENVTCTTMPSKFNSPETVSDAQKLAKNLGVKLLTLPIEPILDQLNQTLTVVPSWDNNGIAYENLQARVRGNILMTLSNQFNSLVLTTGNKSETSVGYATLYGDTAGGFAVIKDVPKTMVYELAEYINKKAGGEMIPVETITREPSAELRADQKDTDSLPDYNLLDRIIKAYVEQDKSPQELIESGLDPDVVCKVIRMVDRNEYKRRQSPPGTRITPRAFGKDRRLPITNRYDVSSHINPDTERK